ncbi:TP53-binding protein 1 isoform X3 [Halichoeres trimaculatus]|uniref:TP53-binding protein 1 isoform X3 n=1 Tax=Halichoeres trimaculatus TaxID=147232 RepID=UPI003D9F4ABB
MDPGAGELDSSLPQPENPCLIVEDSQPDSVALEDDPETSYRALLARRLSSLQPSARSPVLELISSPTGSRSSQTDSQSENSQMNNQTEPANPSPALHKDSQVINVCPPPSNNRCTAEDSEMDSGADSTTHCVQTEEGTSQFGFLELSQSQDLRGEEMNSQEEVVAPQSEKVKPSADQLRSRTSESQDLRAVRSEVSSSSSLESQGGRKISVQVLLHSQGLQDHQILSSQQDLFDADKTGVSVDSTVSEPEQQGDPTSTPAHTLRVLQLSGQGTLVPESLSQSSVDCVPPTPERLDHAPLMVPSSPTEAEDEQAEPMDTSAPPEGHAKEKEEPMETEAVSKPLPSASTPVSQSSPGFVLERTLSLPSQPDFSHDVFVPTQSQESPQHSERRTLSQGAASAPLALQLSVNSQSSKSDHLTCEQPGEDSQATQIEELTQLPTADTCDSVASLSKPRRNEDSPESQTASRSKSSACAETQKSQSERCDPCNLKTNNDALNVRNTTLKHSDRGQKSSQHKEGLSDVNSCEHDASPDPAHSALTPQRSEQVMKTTAHLRVRDLSSQSEVVRNSQEGEELMEEENTVGGALVLSQSQLLSPEPMEEEEDKEEEDSVIIITESDRESQRTCTKTSSSQPIRGSLTASTNGHQNRKLSSDRLSLSQPERAGPELEELKERSLSDSSGEISFHFTLPKDGELIGPAVGATPPLVTQLKQSLRHSTPIEISSFSEKSAVSADVSADVAMAASDIVPGEGGDDSGERGEGKLSLRMKLVTPVEEGSSERFSLQKPALTENEGSVLKVSSGVNSSPSVFSRVRQAHRQQDAQDDHTAGNSSPVRGELFSSPQRSSQASSLGCNSLPDSQSEQASQQQVFAAPQQTSKHPPGPSEPSEDRPGPPDAPQTPSQARVPPKTSNNNVTCSANNMLHQRTGSQQTGADSAGPRSPTGRGEPASPSSRRNTAPSHRRHVRTIQEVRTTVTRIITDVYYEDGKEVDRKVSQEREEPVVDCQVLDSDVSPCRTGSSSLTSGDLADISSLSSKASSLQHSSGGTSSSSGFIRADFILPPSRGGKSTSPRRGGGQYNRGQRGQRAGSALAPDRGHTPSGPRAPLSTRGRARRGRPPSRSSPSRGGGVSSRNRLSAHAQTPWSSEDEPYNQRFHPRLPVSPSDPSSSSRSDSLRSSPEEASSAGSSFVGLRVVAKWSSNGYFYSGRIMKDAGDAKFRLRFDDGYECEVAGKDILLCDPIPVETEVTALLEDQYFSTGVVKGHKTEGEELLYSVERDGQRQWYSRSSIILSLEQGNRLREQHSLGPYEPSTPLTKAADISLDNLVEGKRRRRGAPGGEDSPHRRSSNSPRTPQTPRTPRTPCPPSGKRKLQSSDDSRTPSKRGRRGAGARAAQRTGVCNTSGSGTDLPGRSLDDVTETHGPLPQNTSLFQGFAFMLTASCESDRLTNRNSSEDEEDIVQTGPYNKAYTESQLKAGGGFILPDFNEEQCKAAYQSLLIADQHCRTRKYLLCVASGVPSVSHIWVRDCCKENKLLNYRNYLLPAGAEPEGTVVEWHPRCSPFGSLRVLLVLQQVEEFWSQLIALGGGSAVRHVQSSDHDTADIPAGKFDVVVTDQTCPSLVQEQMTSQEVPLVSLEWIVQSVIRGERLGYDSNPQYRHDYSSS